MERRLRWAIGVYGLIAVVAVLWGVLAGRPNLWTHPHPWIALAPPWTTMFAIVAGVAVGAFTILATRALVRTARWAQHLHKDFRELFGPLTWAQILALGIVPGFAEELLFRGAMQPSLGWLLSSLLFGAIHVARVRSFWAWPIWATLMGLVFGALYAATGQLLAPVIAHCLINTSNLRFIVTHDPEPDRLPHSKGLSPPHLIGTRQRAGTVGSSSAKP